MGLITIPMPMETCLKPNMHPGCPYLEGHEDLEDRLIMKITRVAEWFTGVINLLGMSS